MTRTLPANVLTVVVGWASTTRLVGASPVTVTSPVPETSPANVVLSSLPPCRVTARFRVRVPLNRVSAPVSPAAVPITAAPVPLLLTTKSFAKVSPAAEARNVTSDEPVPASPSVTTPLPTPDELFVWSVPVLMIVPPAYVFDAVSVSVLVPVLMTWPLPEIRPAWVTASDRLNTTVALSTMAPATLPVVPPAPMRRVPAETVVPPVSASAPSMISVPAPVLDRLPCRSAPE